MDEYDELNEFLNEFINFFGDLLKPTEKIGQTKIFDYTISTLFTIDCGWETAIWKGDFGNIIVVARYATKEEAIQGHEDWCYACALKPTKAWSVQTQNYESFEEKIYD